MITHRQLPFKWFGWILILPGLAAVAFSHPLNAIPFAFAILFFLLRGKDEAHRKVLLSSAAIFIGFVVLKATVFKNPYEGGAIGNAKKLVDYFPNYFDLFSNKRFLKDCFYKFYWLPVLLLAISFLYARKGQWLKLVLLLLFLSGYLLLINVSYPDPAVTSFYIENMYLPLAVMVALPFVVDVLPGIDDRFSYFIILLICLTGIIRIYSYHEKYTARVNWERNFLARHQNEKLIVDEKKVPMDTLMMSWGTAYEFWLLSTIESQKTAGILITDRPQEVEWAAGRRKDFVTMWGLFPYSTLDKKYFKVQDTLTAYRLIR